MSADEIEIVHCSNPTCTEHGPESGTSEYFKQVDGDWLCPRCQRERENTDEAAAEG